MDFRLASTGAHYYKGATSLAPLYGGSSSNADSLHTHSGSGTTDLANGSASSPSISWVGDNSNVTGIWIDANAGGDNSTNYMYFPIHGGNGPYLYSNSSNANGFSVGGLYASGIHGSTGTHDFDNTVTITTGTPGLDMSATRIDNALQVRATSGPASAPSYRFTESSNTGMTRVAGSGLYLVFGGAGIYIDGPGQINSTDNEIHLMDTVEMETVASGSSIQYLRRDSSSGEVMYSGSSRRYKMNIRDLTPDTSKIYDLVPKSFEMRKSQLDEEKNLQYTDEASNTSFGLIAEEVHDVLSDLVMYEADGITPDAVDYPLLSVLLLEELKKLRARIEVLEGN